MPLQDTPRPASVEWYESSRGDAPYRRVWEQVRPHRIGEGFPRVVSVAHDRWFSVLSACSLSLPLHIPYALSPEGRAWAEPELLGCPFIDTSTKTGVNAEDPIFTVSARVIRHSASHPSLMDAYALGTRFP